MDSRTNSHQSAGPSGRTLAAHRSGFGPRHGEHVWYTRETVICGGAHRFATAPVSKPAASAAAPSTSRPHAPRATHPCRTAASSPTGPHCQPSTIRVQSQPPAHRQQPHSRTRPPRAAAHTPAAAGAAAAAPGPPSHTDDDAGLAIDSLPPERPAAAPSHPSPPVASDGFVDLGEGFWLQVADCRPHRTSTAVAGGSADAAAAAECDQLPDPDLGAAAAGGLESAAAPAAAAPAAAAAAAEAAAVEGPESAANPSLIPRRSLLIPRRSLLVPRGRPLIPRRRLPISRQRPAADSADPLREACVQLTIVLREAVTWRQVRELLVAHGPSLDGRHLQTAARRLRDVAPQPGRRVAREQALFRTFLAGFLELCRHYLPDMRPSALAGVLYSLVALPCPPSVEWMAAWQVAAEERLSDFGPRELANAAYALGQLGYDPGDLWLGRMCDAAAAHLPAEADAAIDAADAAAAEDTDVGSDLRAPGSGLDDVMVMEVGAYGESLTAADDGGGEATSTPVDATDAAAAEGGGGDGDGDGGREGELRFTSQGLSQLLWGLAQQSFMPPEPVMRALCGEVLRQLPDFTAAGLSNALWGLTTLSYKPTDPWLAAVAAACLRLMPTCSAFDLSICMWALLRLGYTPGGDWLAGFLSASYGQLPSASPEQSSRILWGLAKAGVMPPNHWLRRWLRLSYVQLLTADSRSLTVMVWALSELGIRPSQQWMDLLLAAAWETPLRAFSPRDLTTLLLGLAQCESRPEEAWMDEFWLVSYKLLPVMSARHLSLLVRGCVLLGQAPSERWLAGHEAVTLARMDEQSAVGLALLAYSYGMMERTPSHEWFLALYGACAREGFDGFDAMNLERLIWGIARMGPSDESAPGAVPGWTDAFLRRCAVQMDDVSYCNLANMLYALALLGVRPGAAWLAAAVARGEELLEEFGERTAAKMLWALPRLVSSERPLSVGERQQLQRVAHLERRLEARRRQLLRRSLAGWDEESAMATGGRER